MPSGSWPFVTSHAQMLQWAEPARPGLPGPHSPIWNLLCPAREPGSQSLGFFFCPAPLDCHSKWQNQPLNSKTQLIIVSTAESFLNTRWGQKLYWPSKKVRGWWTLTSPGQCGSFSNTGQIRRVLIFSSWDWQHPHRAKPAKGLERPCSLTISSPIVSQIGKLDNKCPGNEGLLLRLFRYGEED